MRINKFVAQATGFSRRAADEAIRQGRVMINSHPAGLGDKPADSDVVTLDGRPLRQAEILIVMLNKPPGYVCSRNGQGSQTVYDLLPSEYHQLKPVGRLDKDSSGLLLLTNDGQLAQRSTHPSYEKTKIYEISLDRPLEPVHQQTITSNGGVELEDGPSRLALKALDNTGRNWQVIMHEGRNRQIRRTLAQLGYTVARLYRVQFGDYRLGDLQPGDYRNLLK